ncbi:hypothetical protein [Microbispora corallina]|uniref:hypothetical protein n=1 Tax=Microbispora corallina TaxID=83302 RepID=UPI0031D46F44
MPDSPPGTQRHARRWGRFTLHYIEMIIAMFAGMIAAHVAMFPLMLAVMLWRRDEYAHAHH